MKTIMIGLLCLVYSMSSFAEDFLSKGERKLVLREIDSICGDTWCEGEFSYAFNAFYCSKENATCTLEYERWLYYEDHGEREKEVCQFDQLNSFEQLIEIHTFVNDEGELFARSRLTDSFYLRITEECIH